MHPSCCYSTLPAPIRLQVISPKISKAKICFGKGAKRTKLKRRASEGNGRDWAVRPSEQALKEGDHEQTESESSCPSSQAGRALRLGIPHQDSSAEDPPKSEKESGRVTRREGFCDDDEQ